MTKVEGNQIENFSEQFVMKGTKDEKKKRAMTSPVPRKVQNTEAHGYENDQKGINVTS